MKDVWQRIEAWLAANAPKALGALNPPPTEGAIDGLERALGVSLPEDFRESLLLHDGQDEGQFEVFGRWGLLCVTRIRELARLLAEVSQSTRPSPRVGKDDGPVRALWWSPRWVPFALDASGNDLVLDLDPGPGGAYGQVVEYVHDAEIRPWVGSSFRAWLETVAAEMEAGLYEVDEFFGFPRRRE